MHIAFLSSEYPPLRHGGIGTSVRNLGRALVTSGHQVTVLGWGENAEFEDQGVRVRFLRDSSFPRMGWLLNRRDAQRELNRLVQEEGVDIVEAQDWCGLSAGMRLDCPLTIRCHGSATYFAHLLHERVRPSLRWAESLALKQADRVVAVSRFTAETTRRLFRLSEPIGVIPNGIDTRQFSAAKRDEVEPGVILHLGTIVRKKGVLDLCRIFSRVVEKYPDSRLRFIGRDTADSRTSSPSTWALCQELLSPRAKDRTEYLGQQPYEEVEKHIRRAEISVFPSYAEALPLSWMEAMACAKPVVAYDIGWATEIIEPGVSGILVRLGDVEAFAETLLNLLTDQANADGLGAAARRRVEQRFAADVVAASTLDHYERVLTSC